MFLLDWLSWLVSFLIDAQNIIFVLMFMLFCTTIISLARGLRYFLARRESRTFIRETADAFRQCQVHEVLFLAHRKRHSHVAAVVASGLEQFESVSHLVTQAEAVAMARRALHRSSAATHRALKEGLPTLAAVATTAPLVGLLGTVDGILSAFGGSAMQKSTLMRLIMGRLSQSLVTTALGLSVAVLAVWAYNYFSSQLEAFAIETSNASSDLVTFLTVRHRRP